MWTRPATRCTIFSSVRHMSSVLSIPLEVVGYQTDRDIFDFDFTLHVGKFTEKYCIRNELIIRASDCHRHVLALINMCALIIGYALQWYFAHDKCKYSVSWKCTCANCTLRSVCAMLTRIRKVSMRIIWWIFQQLGGIFVAPNQLWRKCHMGRQNGKWPTEKKSAYPNAFAKID